MKFKSRMPVDVETVNWPCLVSRLQLRLLGAGAGAMVKTELLERDILSMFRGRNSNSVICDTAIVTHENT